MRARLEAPGERGALTELWGAALPRQCRAPGAMDSEIRQLRALEAEVAALQRECTMLPEPWEKTSGAWKSFQKFPQSNSEGWESLKDLKSQLGHLKSELSFLSKLTGINIKNYSKIEDITNTEVTEMDTKKVLQRHRLSGSCSMVTFQLEFQVLQIETKEKLSSIITDLNIIMEPTEYSELSEFASRLSLGALECILHTPHSCRMHPKTSGDIWNHFGFLTTLVEMEMFLPTFCEQSIASVLHLLTFGLSLGKMDTLAEEKRDLLMFFRSLHFFVEWYEYRKNTFKHFKEKYPDSVYLSEGTCSHCMEIHSARQPGFELVIVWKIQIDEEGKVFPKLDLLTKVPERALELDKNKIIETAPLSFRSLLGVLGIEAALDSLIKLLCVEND